MSAIAKVIGFCVVVGAAAAFGIWVVTMQCCSVPAFAEARAADPIVRADACAVDDLIALRFVQWDVEILLSQLRKEVPSKGIPAEEMFHLQDRISRGVAAVGYSTCYAHPRLLSDHRVGGCQQAVFGPAASKPTRIKSLSECALGLEVVASPLAGRLAPELGGTLGADVGTPAEPMKGDFLAVLRAAELETLTVLRGRL